MKKSLMLIFFILLTGCTTGGQTKMQTGSDRDAHGCISSAGYVWCRHTGQCERPWELAEREGFENTPEKFRQYCGN